MIDFHRWLGSLADDASYAGDDIHDITKTTASARSTDNIITLNAPYNIDDTAAQHLFDGSITQDGGNTRYSGLVVKGSVPAGTQLQIVQNNALITNYWGTGLNADAAQSILLRIMVKTRTAGADIDGNRIRVQARELGDTYAEFSLTLGLGNQTAAIFTASDLNNQTAAGTIATWTTIVNTEGYQLFDVTGDTVNEPYYSQWDRGSQSINDMFERGKWIQRRGTAETIHGMNGELFRGITHEIAYDTEAGGPFTQNELLTWAGGGEGVLLAIDDQGTTGTIWIQLTKGLAPVDNDTLTGGTSSATCAVNVTVTERPVSSTFMGQSTGSAIIGAYGLGVQPADLTSNDKLFDLTNTQRVPPNNVTFNVSGLVSTEDYVLVGPGVSGVLDDDQLLCALNSNDAGSGSYVASASIPTDTPSTGTIRVFNGNSFDRVPYTSYSGSTFTLTGTLPNQAVSHSFDYDTEAGGPFTVGETLTFSGAGSGTAELVAIVDNGTTGTMHVRHLTAVTLADNAVITGGTSLATAAIDTGTNPIVSRGAFVSYLDKLAAAATESFTSVYSADRELFIRVRDGGATPIKDFETQGTLGSAGGGTTAIRTPDV